MSITVAVVDDDPRGRKNVREFLKQDPRFSFVGECSDGEEAVRELPRLRPQVVLMDVRMPGMSGVDCVRQLAPRMPGTQFLMLTVYEDTEYIFDALASGAHGYLLKGYRAAELLAAIRDVQGGGSPITGTIARKIVQSFRRPAHSPATELTDREAEVLDYLSQGFSYKEIADKMCVSYHTVDSHIRHIYEKLHVRSRSQAIAKYRGDQRTAHL